MAGGGENIKGINKLIHEPARMSIMAILSACDFADFKFLESSTGLTPGNLSSHLTKLEKAGYVLIEKSFRGKVPATTAKITREGSKEFNSYIKRMKSMMKDL